MEKNEQKQMVGSPKCGKLWCGHTTSRTIHINYLPLQLRPLPSIATVALFAEWYEYLHIVRSTSVSVATTACLQAKGDA
jgi:hypothetical protein